jgi:hypothetical protein
MSYPCSLFALLLFTANIFGYMQLELTSIMSSVGSGAVHLCAWLALIDFPLHRIGQVMVNAGLFPTKTVHT